MDQKTLIKGKVHYVGVNDRNKHLFEGMWPLPYGVSYNSYLIDDDIVALVDTVDACFFEAYLRKIRCIIGDRPIQYLIINHMEPDHSGSIRLIKQHYPDIVIVGNKQTFGMIEGYYGVTGERYEVKDGDFLDLGHHKLRFYLTPMVHWPETMMTFDETDASSFPVTASDASARWTEDSSIRASTWTSIGKRWCATTPISWANMATPCRRRWPSWDTCPLRLSARPTDRCGRRTSPAWWASTTA